MSPESAWSYGEIARLIEAVKIREPLYNTLQLEYRSRATLNAYWKEVAEAVGKKSVLQCKERWGILRGIYRRQQRILTLSKEPKRLSVRPWRWADRMSFLSEYCKFGSPSCQSPRPPEEQQTSSPPPVSQAEEDPLSLSPNISAVPLPQPSLWATSVQQSIPTDLEEVRESAQRKKRKKNERDDLLDVIRDYLRMKRSNEEIDPFFVSLTRDMLKLNDRDKSLFKIRVQTMLHDFIYKDDFERI